MPDRRSIYTMSTIQSTGSISRSIPAQEIERRVKRPSKQSFVSLKIQRGATAERSKQVMFSEPYLQVGQMAIMHKSKLGRFSQPWSVFREGVRVGVEPGTTGAAFAERELDEAVVTHVADAEQAFEALRADKIDLYVHDAPTSWALANSSENQDLISLYAPLTQESLAWAVRPGEHEFLGELNQALGLMRSNGTLTYILNRWIPVQVEVR